MPTLASAAGLVLVVLLMGGCGSQAQYDRNRTAINASLATPDPAPPPATPDKRPDGARAD